MEKENRKQIYVWDDNLEFYEALKNKSKLVNLLLIKYRQEIEDGTSE